MMRFLFMLAAINRAMTRAQDTQRKIELQRQKEILNEADIARRNNAVVIQDLQIELLKLKIEAEKRKTLGDADSFRSEEY